MQIKRTIRRPEVLKKTGLSATTIYNLEKSGQFPPHFMLTPRCAAWDEAEVDAWLDARKARPAKGLPGPDSTLRRVGSAQ
jgi:prophage regulatory protein